MTDSAASEEPTDLVLGLLQIGPQVLGVHIDYLAEVAHIDTLQPMLGRSGALGIIAIRGTLVPVLDPFGEFHGSDRAPKISAIISSGGQSTGLAVDRVLGLRRFEANRVQHLDGVGGPRLTLGTIHEDGALIYILDAATILGRDEFPKTHSNVRQALKSGRTASRPCLTFEAGGVAFAVRAEAIFGTVPRQEIQDETMATDGFLGTIRYFGRRVPVMAADQVFGLGHARTAENFETVVLQFPDGCLLGLAADKISQIAHPAEDDLRPLAFQLNPSFSLLSATVRFDGIDHFLIDEARIHQDASLMNVAHLSRDDEESKSDEPIDAPTQQKGGAVHERERYLMLRSGTDLAVRMTDVEGLRKPPDANQIIPPHEAVPGLVGLFFQNDVPTPLINLSQALGLPEAPDPARSRVVLVRDDGLAVGFLVDSMEGIATSTRYVASEDRQAEPFDLVELSVQGRKETRNCFDIKDLSRKLVPKTSISPLEMEVSK